MQTIVPKLLAHKKYDEKFEKAIDALKNKKIFVLSNSEACRRLKANPINSIAITNELASKHYNLYCYNILRKKMKMPFIAFSLLV